ncbi:hypothetical protein [Alloscardovia criceti]|uniref:hypothetical protein n=1 Tax=Alloscardovia criceti TaxID=356828 RepID=UPI0003793BEF|nr:hypothetical protein [Alloscardovia criceti]
MTQLDQVDWETGQNFAQSNTESPYPVNDDTQTTRPNNTENIEYVGTSTEEWPIRVRKFHPQDFRKNTVQDAWKSTFISGFLCVIIPSVVLYFFRNPTIFVFWLIFIGFFLMLMHIRWSSAIRDTRKFERARDGLLIAQKDIMAVYRKQGLAKLSLVPSRLQSETRDGGSGYLWTEQSFPVYALWFYDDGREHSYVLYWREYDYDVMAREAMKAREQVIEQTELAPGEGTSRLKELADAFAPIPQPIGEKVDKIRENMGKFWGKLDHLPPAEVETMLREFDGTDIRMRPCVLEVQGNKARLRFDKNAPLVAFADAGVDRNIRPGGHFPLRLMDTFNPQEQKEEWERAQKKRDMPIEEW